jgi:cupin 2 domain-containing protein
MSTNLFADLPPQQFEESTLVVAESKHVRIERIVSHGQASPPGFWYDQQCREWVILLRGAARLLLEDGEQTVEMKPGDFIDIPANCRHRVEWTSPDEPTVWLAIHFAD